MKIGIISTFPPVKCGIGEYTYDLVSGIMEHKPNAVFTVFRLSTLEGTVSPEEYKLLNEIEIVDVGLVRQVNYNKLLREIERRGPFDVIHIQHEYSLFAADDKFLNFLREVKRYCYRLVITMHNVRHPLYYPGIDKYQRKITELVDVVIVHSTLQEVELVHQGADPDKIIRIPHGTRIAKIVSKIDAARELNLDIDTNKKVLLVQGFLRQDKGLHIIAKALDILISREGEKDIVFVLAGQVQNADVNQQYVNNVLSFLTQFKEHVIVLNKYLTRREVDLVYSLADVIVFPYIDVTGDIGVSGAFHWAIGSMKPVLCARVPRLVECYELAPRLTFPPRNPEALAAKIKLVIHNYKEVLEYMKPLVEYARETSWVNIGKIYLKLYSGVEPYMIDIHYFKLPLVEVSREVEKKVERKSR